MGANLSTPEKIAKCCRAGDATSLAVRAGLGGSACRSPPCGSQLPAAARRRSLPACRRSAPSCFLPAWQALLADLQRNDAAFRANRGRYLEAVDDNGNTPLTLAAARGHLPCVKLVRAGGCPAAVATAAAASCMQCAHCLCMLRKLVVLHERATTLRCAALPLDAAITLPPRASPAAAAIRRQPAPRERQAGRRQRAARGGGAQARGGGGAAAGPRRQPVCGECQGGWGWLGG